MEDLLTVKQVSILLKVHQLTVRRYIKEGKLKAVKVGGNVRISQSELNSFGEIYISSTKSNKSTISKTGNSSPFSPNDAIFRLKGRGLSIDGSNN